MKKYQHLILCSTALLAAMFVFSFYHINGQRPGTGNTPGFAVVELFTSEGCSSCPAADQLGGIIAGEKAPNVYVLSFHVDYWDRLGWKDMFSSSLYSDRQKQYAGVLRLKSMYTPQMVVNGRTEFVGSDENKLRSTIKRELGSSSATVIELRTRITDDKTVGVSFNSNNEVNSILNIALVQKHAETSVKKGENAGRLMKHYNVVRDFKKFAVDAKGTGKVILSIPDGLSAIDFRVIAFIQNADDYKITAAAQNEIQ